jgi:hypothetical protein
MITRRNFNKSLLAFCALSGAGFAGCPSLTTIEGDIDAYVPLALDAFDGILALFDPPLALVLLPISNIVIAGIKAIETAIADWQTADAAQKPGLLGGIIAAIQTAQKDIGNFLAAVNVQAPALLLPAKALAAIVLGVLQFFANRLSGSATTAASVITIQSGTMQVEPLNLSQSKFRTKFDGEADHFGHPEAHGRWGKHKKKK